MAYNNGREDRKWRIWKEAEEKVLREHGVDETTIEQIRIDDRADFNSNRRFYHWTSDFGEYLEGMADKEQSSEIKTVTDLLDEIEDENAGLFHKRDCPACAFNDGCYLCTVRPSQKKVAEDFIGI